MFLFAYSFVSNQLNNDEHEYAGGAAVSERFTSTWTTCAPLGWGKERGKLSKSVYMVLNVHRNHTAYQGRGEEGKGIQRWGKREITGIHRSSPE